MEYNKFHLISFILQISDLDIAFQDLYFLHVTLMTGKKLHLNTLLTKSYDEMPSVKCRPSSAQRQGFLSSVIPKIQKLYRNKCCISNDLIINRHWTIGTHNTKVQNYSYCSQNTENDSKVSPVNIFYGNKHQEKGGSTLSILQTWRTNS